MLSGKMPPESITINQCVVQCSGLRRPQIYYYGTLYFEIKSQPAIHMGVQCHAGLIKRARQNEFSTMFPLSITFQAWTKYIPSKKSVKWLRYITIKYKWGNLLMQTTEYNGLIQAEFLFCMKIRSTWKNNSSITWPKKYCHHPSHWKNT